MGLCQLSRLQNVNKAVSSVNEIGCGLADSLGHPMNVGVHTHSSIYIPTTLQGQECHLWANALQLAQSTQRHRDITRSPVRIDPGQIPSLPAFGKVFSIVQTTFDDSSCCFLNVFGLSSPESNLLNAFGDKIGGGRSERRCGQPSREAVMKVCNCLRSYRIFRLGRKDEADEDMEPNNLLGVR